MEKINCIVWSESDDSESLAIIVMEPENDYSMKLIIDGGESLDACGGNALSSFNLIRAQLEPSGRFLLCNGSKIDVAASSLGRGSRATRKVYRLKLGQPGLREDLVDIFDPIDKLEVTTMDRQKIFYNKWINSLK